MDPKAVPSKEEQDMVRQAMALPLDIKVQQAIGLLKLYEPTALRLSPDGYYVAYSGGKDSGVILDLAVKAGVRHKAHYNVTTIDPPELVRFIRREHPEVAWNRPDKSMMTAVLYKTNGPPTRLARWCCEKYKERGGDGMAQVIGVRASESPRRKAVWKQVVPRRQRGNDSVYLCPIVYWTDKDVWEYHRVNGLKHCGLYDEGFSRLGCIGCPLAGAKQMQREFKRWPRYARNWERAVKKNWELWHSVPRLDGKPRYQAGFQSAEEFWQWWISGERKKPVEYDCQAAFMFSQSNLWFDE